MQIILFFSSVFLSSLYSFGAATPSLPAKEFYRLQESKRVISEVSKIYWPQFGKFQGPWVYAMPEGQYIINGPKTLKGYQRAEAPNIKADQFQISSIQWQKKTQQMLDGTDLSKEPVFVFNISQST